MSAIAAYVLWTFCSLTALLLVRMLAALFDPIMVDQPMWLKVGGWLSFVLAIVLLWLVTYFTAWHGAEQVFDSSITPWPSSLSWTESSQLGLINLTLWSFDAAIVLAGYRLWHWVKGTEQMSLQILAGRAGRVLNIVVTILSITSSVITIAAALSPH